MKIYVPCAIIALMLAGCAAASGVYPYRAQEENCDCEVYRARDAERGITYVFRASYTMHAGVTSTIEIEFMNDSNDTLFLDPGTATVSSRNVSYQYNNKPVPLPRLVIAPSRSDVVHFVGTDVSGREDWDKIAGERLTVTLRGIRLGASTLSPRQVTFIPVNPKMHE